MKTSIIMAASIIIMALGVQCAIASDLSYDNFTLYVDQGSADDSDYDSSGFGVAGSISLNENFFVIGGFYNGETDEEFCDWYCYEVGEIELEQFHIGFGMHTPINDKTDFVGTFAVMKNEFSIGGDSETYTDKQMTIGVRHLLDPKFEVSASLLYVMFDELDNEMGGRIGATFHASESIAISLRMGQVDKARNTALGFTVKF